MVATEAQIDGERLYRIDTAFFERLLQRYHKTEVYDSFRRAIDKYTDGSRKFYRLDSDEKPQELNEFGKCEDEKDRTIIERPIWALVAYQPLTIEHEKEKIPIDSYFDIWFHRNLGLDTPMTISLDSSVLRRDEKPRYAGRVQDITDVKTIEQWNRERILGLERDKLRGVPARRRSDGVLSTYREFSWDHAIEESGFSLVDGLLYKIFNGIRSGK